MVGAHGSAAAISPKVGVPRRDVEMKCRTRGDNVKIVRLLRHRDQCFSPGHLATATGFALAIVFSVQGLTGWESAVPLAEETASPRRNVPIATMVSIVITGVMTVVVIW